MTIPNGSRCFHINGNSLINLISCAGGIPAAAPHTLTSVYGWRKPRFPPNPFSSKGEQFASQPALPPFTAAYG
jgi:hypothetical protein